MAYVVASYERWGTNRLRMLAQEDRIAVVARNVEEGRHYHLSWVERTFAPLIGGLEGAARTRRTAALAALTDVYTWRLLRLDLGLGRADTERTLVEMIGRLRAALWRAPLYLYLTAAPFESPALEFPPSFRLVGPGIWEPPTDAPEWLAELEEPVVLVSASSEFQRDDALVETALEALRCEDVRVVVTTAAHHPERFRAPPNARIARWIPHGPILRKAACVVCHGAYVGTRAGDIYVVLTAGTALASLRCWS